MTLTARGSVGSSGVFAPNACTPHRTPATAPVQGRNFSNEESGMAGSFRMAPVTLTGDPRFRRRPARPHDPAVPAGPGTVPGTSDTGFEPPQNGGVEHTLVLLGALVPAVVGVSVLRRHPRH